MRKIFLALSATIAVLASSAIAGTFPPAPGPYGLRGGFNDWGLTEMTWDGTTSTYSATLAITAGNYNFKISDNDWSDPITFGNPGGSIGTFSPDTTVDIDIATGFGTDLNMDILTDGVYEFVLDLSGWTNSGANDARLSIQLVPIPAAGLLLLSAIGGLGFLRRRRD